MRKSILVLCLITLLTTVAMAAAGCTGPGGTPTISEVTTCTSVTPEGKPVSPAASFPASTPKIFVSARVNGASDNVSVGVKWYHISGEAGSTVNQLLTESLTTVKGNSYVAFDREATRNPWGVGLYKVLLSVEGKDAATGEFKVTPDLPDPKSPPVIGFFAALPDSVNAGQATSLFWSATNAVKVELEGVGEVPATGSRIVAPSASTEYRLIARNNNGNTGMKATVNVSAAAAGGKPDLVISDFGVEDGTAYCKVRNIGGAAAGPSTTYLSLRHIGLQAATSPLESLAPGEERKQVFSGYTWPWEMSRTYMQAVMVCADGGKQLEEASATNNCLLLMW